MTPGSASPPRSARHPPFAGGGEEKLERLLAGSRDHKRRSAGVSAHVPDQLLLAAVCVLLRPGPAGRPAGASTASGWRAGQPGGALASPPSARPWRATYGVGGSSREGSVSGETPFRGKG